MAVSGRTQPTSTPDGHARVHAERDAATDALFAELTRLGPDADERAERQLKDEVFALHEELCDSLARRYANRGVDRDDLLQVARLALVKAIRRYDASTGTTFAGYAVPTITGELKRHFRDHAWVVRPTRRVQELHLTLRRQRETVTHELRRVPTRTELARLLDVGASDVAEADGADTSYRPLSFDAPTPTGAANGLADTVGHDDPGLEGLCDHVDLAGAVAHLPADSRELLRMRFVEERTQREIAGILGTSQMQVSRLLARIFAELRPRLAVDRSPASNSPLTTVGA